MLSTSSLHWHGPERKLSTPFFPGAWPNNSTHSALLSTFDSKDAVDLEAQLQSAGPRPKVNSSTTSSDGVEQSCGEHTMTLHGRMHHAPTEGQTNEVYAVEQASPVTMLSTALSESSQMTTLTRATSSSNISDTLATPNKLSPSNTMLGPESRRKSRSFTKRFSFQRLLSNDKSTSSRNHIPAEVEVPAVPSDADDIRSAAPSTSPLTSVPGLPPLSLPSHTLAFSPESVASYFSASDQSSRMNATVLSTSPSSPSVFSPSPLDSRSSFSAMPDADAALSVPVIITSLEDHEFEQSPRGSHDTSAPQVASSRPNGDSPILPSDEDASSGILPSQRSKHLRSMHVIAPSSADMDAFGLAAAGEAGLRSTSSIPTSFRSAYAADSVSCSQSLSMDDTARGRARRQSSVSLSLSLNLSQDSIDPTPNEAILHMVRSRDDYDFDGANVYDHTSITYPPMKVSNDPPFSTVTTATQTYDGATNRFLNLNRMKKFGGKIKQFFRGKTSTGIVEGAIGVTTTAVTTVEYTSKHPITLPKDKGKRKALEKKQSNLSSARRQSMPMSVVGPALTVSNPRPLRPSSFLLLEDPSERTASRRLSVKSSTSARRLRDEHTLGPDANPSKSKKATNNYANPPAITASPTAPRTRPRTQTAPHRPTHGGAVKPRRMSLSSAISRSKFDMLKTAIVPHPPLPQHVTDTIREDLRTRAAAFSPEPIYDNGTLLNGGDAMATETFEPESEALRAFNDQPQNSSVAEHSEANERAIRANELLAQTHYAYGDHEDEEHGEPVFVKDDKVPQTPRRSIRAVASGMRRTPQTPGETPSQSKGRRARGFSLSSAISSRAMKAKSLILGRPTLQEPGPRLPPSLVGTPARQDERIFSPTSSVGCADYEPNLALDNISFAHMSAFTSSAVSTEDMLSREISPSEQDVHKITLNGLPVDTGAVGMDVGEGDGKAEDKREEQQRSLVCALGLPYEDQAQTTSDSS